MQFIQTGQFDTNALENHTTLEDPLERAQRITLNRLNHLLGFIQELGDEVLLTYTEQLSDAYQNLVTGNTVIEKQLNLEDLIAEKDHLNEYPKLAQHILNYHLQLLDLPPKKDWQNEAFQIAQLSILRSVLVPAYYNLLILTETIGKDQAFLLHKKFTTSYILLRQNAEVDEFESIEALYQNNIHPTDESSGWVMMQGLVGDGKYAYKNENCLWVEALADFPDAEIKYHICCYGDYQGAKSWNQNFILTMEHTIAEGAPYCSRVVHDTRVNWKLDHPPKKFWDEMKP